MFGGCEAKIRRKEIVILCCRSRAIIDIVYCRLMFSEALDDCKLNYFKVLSQISNYTRSNCLNRHVILSVSTRDCCCTYLACMLRFLRFTLACLKTSLDLY